MDNRTILYDSFDKEPELLTFDDLRQRLKSIATLCIGLSIDLNNEIQLRDELIAEIDRLRSKLKESQRKHYNLRSRYSGTLCYYHKKYGYHRVRRSRSGDNNKDNNE